MATPRADQDDGRSQQKSYTAHPVKRLARGAAPRQDRQDGAELDQHLEGVVRRVEADEVPDEELVPRRGDRDELGGALDHGEHDRLRDAHRIHH